MATGLGRCIDLDLDANENYDDSFLTSNNLVTSPEKEDTKTSPKNRKRKTMVQFSGKLLGKSFGPTEASTPHGLYEIWKSAEDPPIADVRCWVFSATDTASVWIEILLNLPNFFETIKGYLEGGELLIEFRAKGASSPNASANNSPSKESGVETEDTVKVTESLSTLGLSSVISTPTSGSGRSTPREAINLSILLNDKDPFTMEHVREIEDPYLLQFLKNQMKIEKEILCVSLASFEQFVRSEADAGKNMVDLELNRIMCNDGRQRNFVCSVEVWLFSVLEHSQKMRNSFRQFLKCSIIREKQLRALVNEKHLWLRVRVWVSDFLDFGAAQERLTLPPEDGLTPFMSPFYFSKAEAESLGGVLMPNATSLSTTISIMLEGKANDGALEVCASHDIAPVLYVAFGIKSGFHKKDQFIKEKKKWIKQQEKEMRKKK